MDIQEKALPPAGQAQPTQNEKHAARIDGKDRLCLLLTLGFCVILVDSMFFHQPGLGVTVSVWCWSALLALYVGRERMGRKESRFLLAANLLLSLTFALQSNWYFRLWNIGALLVLVPVQTLGLIARRSWWQPAMLGERAYLFFQGLFGNLPAVGGALTWGKGRSRRWPAVALGLAAAVVMALLLIPVLASADALFSSMTSSLLDFCRAHLTAGLARFLIALAIAPFVFGLLYSLRYPKDRPVTERAAKSVDGLPFAILLGGMVLVYLVFLGVQAAGLFGGASYLASRGIAYADWARSGFFQMVGVTVVNLAVTMATLRWSARAGRSWGGVRALATVLIAQSFLLLASALWRMSLYVGAYGLSFKRCMTYWGMGMMAVFLAAALASVWREKFRFCRVAFLAAVLGWLLISLTPVDYLVARDNVDRYLSGQSQTVSVGYLTSLSYDTASQLSRLDGAKPVSAYEGGTNEETLQSILRARQEEARWECQTWESWNLSAYLAGRG